MVVETKVLTPEMERRLQSERYVAVDAPVAKHTYAETKVHFVIFNAPLGTCCGVYVAVVLKFNALVVDAEEETVVETAFVNKWFVLHLTFLCRHAEGDEG